MATRTVFTDENSNEMECYLNDKGSLFIKVGERRESFENSGYCGYVINHAKFYKQSLSNSKDEYFEVI